MKEILEFLIFWIGCAILSLCRICLMFFVLASVLEIIKGELNDSEMAGCCAAAFCLEVYQLLSWLYRNHIDS